MSSRASSVQGKTKERILRSDSSQVSEDSCASKTSTTHIEEVEARPRSPLSIERKEEKDELVRLNTRLASYIDYVQSLECDNKTLTLQIDAQTKSETTKISEVKRVYEEEVESLRKEVDRLSSINTSLKISKKKFEDLVEDLRTRIKQAECETTKLLADLDKANAAFENEVLLRTEAENKALTHLEKLEFERKVHSEERQTWSSQCTILRSDSFKLSDNDVGAKLMEDMHEFRADRDAEIDEYREELERRFNQKLEMLSKDASFYAASNKESTEALARQRAELISMRSEISAKDSELSSLRSKVKDLDYRLTQERQMSKERINHLEHDVLAKTQELAQKFKEFQTLQDNKVKLDQEIHMYRKLIESEEKRCNLSGDNIKESPFYTPSNKRRRSAFVHNGDNSSDFVCTDMLPEIKTSAMSKVKFCSNVDLSGKCVRIRNESDEEFHLGKWTLQYKCGQDDFVYNFPRKCTLAGKATCTIWSANSNTPHSPPNDLLMKGLNFKASQDFEIVLRNDELEDVAHCTVKPKQRPIMKAKRVSVRNDLKPGEERCCIM